MKVVVCSFLFIWLSSAIVTSTDVFAKNGSEAILPCQWADDSVRWYGIGDHQYSSGKQILKSLPLSLQERLHIIDRDGYSLGISLVQKDDEGIYKCTSDNGTIYDNLHLIVAPTSISFLNSLDENTITADENQEFKVICKADGGYPPPKLSLLWNEILITSSESRSLSYEINLTRADDFTNVTCIANHSDLHYPLEIKAMFYLNLAPTQLTMMDLPIMFEGQLVNISCVSIGSRPQASCEWTADGIVIANSSVDESEIMYPFKTYRIKSTLSIEFDRTQNRKLLSCRTFHLADRKGIRQTQMMEIYYPPSIDIIYQNTTEDEEKRTLVCKPKGNPAVYEFFEWEHLTIYNEFIRHLKGGETGEVILPVVNSEERYQDSGIYKCHAQNDIADKHGNKIQNGSVSFISEGIPAASSENVYSNKRKLAEDTILIVRFVSMPAPLEVFWFKIDEGRNILLNDSINHTKVTRPAMIKDSFHGRTIHVDGYITTLFIRKLKVNDFTKYRCEIHNKLGNMSLTIQIEQNTDFEPDASLQTTGIVLTLIGGLLILLHVAFLVYKWRRNNCDEDTNETEEFHSMELVLNIANMDYSESPATSVTGNNGDGLPNEDIYETEDSIPTEQPLTGPSLKHVSRKPLPPLPPVSPPSYKSMDENTSMNIEYTKPYKIKRASPTSPRLNQVSANRPMNTTDSICNNVECQQPVLMTDVIPTAKELGVSQKQSPAISKTLSRSEEEVLSSGFDYSSFSGPNTMDQRQTKPSSMNQIFQDILEEEDGSNNSSDEEKEDEAMSMNNPSYQEKGGETNALDEPSDQKEVDDVYDDAQSAQNDVRFVNSENGSSDEKISTEEVIPPSTNKDKKKPSQYYPTFPKSDDGTWKEPAEPIKELDESQEETHLMELDKKLNAHNDEEKMDSTS